MKLLQSTTDPARNVIAVAPTGTGKTLAAVICAAALATQPSPKRVLFLVPTRDLALQVSHWISRLSPDHRIADVLISDREPRQMPHTRKCPILVATPKPLGLQLASDSGCFDKIFIDEVDTILHSERNPGTKAKGKRKAPGQFVFDTLCKSRQGQMVVFSATINRDMLAKIERGFRLHRPASRELPSSIIYLGDGSESSEKCTTTHVAYYVEDDEHGAACWRPVNREEEPSVAGGGNSTRGDDDDVCLQKIVELFQETRSKKALLFCSSSVSVTRLVARLNERGLRADKLINRQDYELVDRPAFDPFASSDLQVLVATEYAARGIDIPDLDCVFVLGPMNPHAYLHCSGRVGRFGSAGRCITILAHKRYVRQYELALQILGVN
ncbi:ATP-dependent RNA helicase RhlE [Kappamyces sp. JEL0829]|nr:ATP-dependent RNA helicase RhlE [Kappamyces sp. JEL0829]